MLMPCGWFSARFNKNFQFDYSLNGENSTMIFTSVTGHLMELGFTASHQGWGSCAPAELYGAPLVKRIPDVRPVMDDQQHLQTV